MAQTAVVLLKGTLLGGAMGWRTWRWCCSRELCLAVLWDSTDGGGAAQENSAWRSCGMAEMAVVLLKGTLLGGVVG